MSCDVAGRNLRYVSRRFFVNDFHPQRNTTGKGFPGRERCSWKVTMGQHAQTVALSSSTSSLISHSSFVRGPELSWSAFRASVCLPLSLLLFSARKRVCVCVCVGFVSSLNGFRALHGTIFRCDLVPLLASLPFLSLLVYSVFRGWDFDFQQHIPPGGSKLWNGTRELWGKQTLKGKVGKG